MKYASKQLAAERLQLIKLIKNVSLLIGSAGVLLFLFCWLKGYDTKYSLWPLMAGVLLHWIAELVHEYSNPVD